MTDARAWIGDDGSLYVTRQIILTSEFEEVIVNEYAFGVDDDGGLEWIEYEPGDAIQHLRAA